MKIVFITGNHPRHASMAKALQTTGFLSQVIIEQREHFLPAPPESICDDLKNLFNHNFKQREQTEKNSLPRYSGLTYLKY